MLIIFLGHDPVHDQDQELGQEGQDLDQDHGKKVT